MSRAKGWRREGETCGEGSTEPEGDTLAIRGKVRFMGHEEGIPLVGGKDSS